MSAFIDRLEEAGLLDAPAPRGTPQDQAIAGLCREYAADSVTVVRLANGSRRVTLRRYDQDRPVGKATVKPDGRVETDLTEVIA